LKTFGAPRHLKVVSLNEIGQMLNFWAPPASAFFAMIAAAIAARSAKMQKRQSNAALKASLAAAKANALASRVTSYDAQIADLQAKLKATELQANVAGPLAMLRDEIGELTAQRNHLRYHLDRVLGDLGVGLGDPAGGSPYNGADGKTKWTEGSHSTSSKIQATGR
jgi:hypothetical protein